MTLMPCRLASWPTTNRPSCSVLAGVRAGGLASRSFSSCIRCGTMPRPRSSISIANPLATFSPVTRTWVNGGDRVVAFSISSASRWITSVTAEAAQARAGLGGHGDPGVVLDFSHGAAHHVDELDRGGPGAAGGGAGQDDEAF